ncbi:diguanylate cyclase [Massilia sp. 9096]|uniref:diguanylate cyclase n=1 Tax=Massilia sp. 9096 TaxID=1500894 RepID=UPI000564535A|nr:diguanylate cyclase [Massilia sp. 9096]
MTERIDRHLKWLGALILAIVAVLAALPYLSSREADATMAALSQVAARERTYEELLGALIDAETGQRGFIVTGDPAFLADYDAGLATVAAKLRTLRAGPTGGDEGAALERIAALTARKMAEMADTIALRRAHGFEAAGRAVADLRGKHDMDSLRALIGQRVAALAARRAALRQRTHATLADNSVLGIIASLVSGAVVFLALFVAARHLRERAEAAAQARVRNQRLEVTAQMLQALDSLTANAELPAILPVFLARLLPGSAGAVYLYRSSRDFLQLAALWGEAADAGAAHDELINPGECWGLRFGGPHLARGADSLRCPHGRHAGPAAAGDAGLEQLCVPMVSQGEVIGLLVVRRPRGAAEIEQTVAVTVAEQLALGISNINLREMLRRQSSVDELTGLYNRRYFDEAVKREVFRAERKGAPFALVMVDLDHFKRMNDMHGHDAGDLALQAAARCLQDGIRRSDLACRYGGEEMALLLVDCDALAATRCAEAIRAAIAALSLEQRSARLPGLTASFGVAAWPDHGATPEDLLKAADRALYASKHAGRDRVTLA